MTFSTDPQNLSAFKIIGAIGAERRAKGGALFHITLNAKYTCIRVLIYEQ